MRTILRLCLVASLVAAVGIAAVPVAQAKHKANVAHHKDKKQNKKIKKANRKAKKAHARIGDLKDWSQTLSDWNDSQDETLNGVKSTVDAIVAGVPTIIQGLTDLKNGLLAIQDVLENDVADGFAEIEAALQDPVTGLVGLNLARPQFGAFGSDGTFIGGTGPGAGSGPEGDALQGPGGPGPDIDGMFVVDFGNDVSERMYTVNVFPLGPPDLGGTGAAPTASATNCASHPDVAAACGLVDSYGPSDADPNKVIVQIGDGESGGPLNGFSLTAISG